MCKRSTCERPKKSADIAVRAIEKLVKKAVRRVVFTQSKIQAADQVSGVSRCVKAKMPVKSFHTLAKKHKILGILA